MPRRCNVGAHKVYVTFTRVHMYADAHVYDMVETRLGRGEGRRRSGLQGEDRRGRIGASEAEASLLGDYGSLIPIQRSELHAERKSRPKSRGYHAENV